MLPRALLARLAPRFRVLPLSTVPLIAARRFEGSDPKGSPDPKQRLKEITEYYSQYELEYTKGFEEVDEAPAEDLVLPVSTERGKTGVFDLDELVGLLRFEKAADICCIRVPKEISYCDYLILCSSLSPRHLAATVNSVNRVYKMKKGAEDPFARVEGEKDPTWKVVDMGSIVLHVMSRQTRERYDVETLWTVGPGHDEKTSASLHATEPGLDPAPAGESSSLR